MNNTLWGSIYLLGIFELEEFCKNFIEETENICEAPISNLNDIRFANRFLYLFVPILTPGIFLFIKYRNIISITLFSYALATILRSRNAFLLSLSVFIFNAPREVFFYVLYCVVYFSNLISSKYQYWRFIVLFGLGMISSWGGNIKKLELTANFLSIPLELRNIVTSSIMDWI